MKSVYNHAYVPNNLILYSISFFHFTIYESKPIKIFKKNLANTYIAFKEWYFSPENVEIGQQIFKPLIPTERCSEPTADIML